MLRKFLFLLLVFTVSSIHAQDENDLNIVPKPLSVKYGNRNIKFDFTKDTKIIYGLEDENAKYAANELNKIAVSIFGKKLKKATKMTSDNNVIFKFDGSMKPEEYTLYITPENIIIKAKDGAGAFYAVQTLKQLIPVQAYETPIDLEKISLPTMTINDAPHFPYRGFMLDCSRHFWSVETIKEVLDILAMHKMNRFHWHLTEDQGWRIEIKKYPLLTKIGSLREQTTTGHNEGLDGIPYGGYYTQREIKESVDRGSQ